MRDASDARSPRSAEILRKMLRLVSLLPEKPPGGTFSPSIARQSCT
jgi:hypothetical protein